MTKHIFALALAFAVISGIIPISATAEDTNVIFKMEAGNLETYSTVTLQSAQSVSLQSNPIVVTGNAEDTYVSFTVFFKTPYNNNIPVKDMEMIIKSRIKVECGGVVESISSRLYNSFDTYSSIYLYNQVEAGAWMESEVPLSNSSTKVGEDSLYSGGEITRMRFDVKKAVGADATVYLDYISFLQPPEYDASKIKGREILEGVELEIANASPGDTVIIPNGTYENVYFHAIGNGTEGNPITVRAETPGGVIFTGFSKMTIGGEYVTVDSVLFKDGWAYQVIVFAPRSEHCRLTNSAVINFNKADKSITGKWVVMYGKYNRADHNFFRDKRNIGQLFEVVYHTAGDPPEHTVDNNYFGYREQASVNGYEVLRFGNTQDWTATLNCTARNNYFDNCDGESETISNKSNGNKYINNTFFDTLGALSLRTHKDFLVEGNLFVGNGRNTTRKTGVAIMGSDAVIKNNYFYNLPISSYAITLENGTDMEGNPAAYIPVTNVQVENNTLVNCGVGISVGTYGNTSQQGVAFPRIYPPTDTTISDNLIFNDNSVNKAFSLDDAGSQVVYENNQIVGNIGFDLVPDGVANADVMMERKENGLYFPIDTTIGADYSVVSKAHTSPLQFLPEWIVEKIQANDPEYKVNDVISVKLEPMVFVFPAYFMDSDGRIYTFARMSPADSKNAKEFGFMLEGEESQYYSLTKQDSAIKNAKKSGMFGVGLYDPAGKLGIQYGLIPYVKIDEDVFEGAAIFIDKSTPEDLD